MESASRSTGVDLTGAQTGDVGMRDVAEHIVNTGADADEVLALLRYLVEKDATYRQLYADSLERVSDKADALHAIVEAHAEALRELRRAVSTGDATVLSMTDERFGAWRAEWGPRLASLESGALAGILAHLKADTDERTARQSLQDTVNRVLIGGLGLLILVVVGAAAVVIIAGVR